MQSVLMPFFELPTQPEKTPAKRASLFVLVGGLHILVLVLVLTVVARPEIQKTLASLNVRLIELRPEPEPPKVEPPKPRPSPAPPRKTLATPPPVLVAAQPSPVVSSFVVVPQPPVRVVEPVPQAVVAPAPVVAPRFDADYLQNPKPVYPAISRRLSEEGRVVLRVKVSHSGLPLSVDIKQSSGFVRLDDAARGAVERWKFVPAKQGGEAIEAWVLVPLHFSLDS
jgi:protein TonB